MYLIKLISLIILTFFFIYTRKEEKEAEQIVCLLTNEQIVCLLIH
jgi:hypothetical protein